MLAVLWLLTKFFLHGQLSWLVWTPVLTGLAHTVLAAGRAVVGPLLMVGAYGGMLIAAPIVLGFQQRSAERAYVADVRGFLRQAPQLLSDETLVQAAWEICDGLDAVAESADALGSRDPIEFVASVVLQMGNPDGWEGSDQREIEALVRSADQHLCSITSPFAFPWRSVTPISAEFVSARRADSALPTTSSAPSWSAAVPTGQQTTIGRVPEAPPSSPTPSATPTAEETPQPMAPPEPVSLTCDALAKAVSVSYVRASRDTGVGAELWPRVTIRNSTRAPVTVTFDGHGKASNPEFPEFPMEMMWGVDDAPVTVPPGKVRSQDLGEQYGEVLYVPPGGKVLEFVVTAMGAVDSLGLNDCALAVRRR